MTFTLPLPSTGTDSLELNLLELTVNYNELLHVLWSDIVFLLKQLTKMDIIITLFEVETKLYKPVRRWILYMKQL